jgi:putative oxidoreductase
LPFDIPCVRAPRRTDVLPTEQAMMNIAEISATWSPRVLSVLRIVAGLLLLQYGLAKLVGWPVVKMFENLPWLSLFGVAGMFELVGGVLLILGLFTRPVAFVLSGEMAAAYFIEHFPRGFFPVLNHGDLAIALCFIFFYIAFAGGGPWSLDAVMNGKR